VRDEGISPDGLFYAAVHRTVDIGYQGASAVFAMKIIAADPAAHCTHTLPPYPHHFPLPFHSNCFMALVSTMAVRLYRLRARSTDEAVQNFA
jgi:hypothetical protein